MRERGWTGKGEGRGGAEATRRRSILTRTTGERDFFCTERETATMCTAIYSRPPLWLFSLACQFLAIASDEISSLSPTCIACTWRKRPPREGRGERRAAGPPARRLMGGGEGGRGIRSSGWLEYVCDVLVAVGTRVFRAFWVLEVVAAAAGTAWVIE